VDDWRDAEAFGPDDLFSFAPPDQAYAGRICRARYGITMFDPALLGQVAGTGRPRTRRTAGRRTGRDDGYPCGRALGLRPPERVRRPLPRRPR
jgi:hypothetical protein